MPAADGRMLEWVYCRPGPAASPRGRDALIFNRICPVIRPARCFAPRRRHGLRFARWNGLASGRPSRRCSKRKMSERSQLFLSRTKPAIRRHSRSYGKGCQCRYRQKEQNLVCIFYACCNAKRRPPGCPLKCGLGKAGFCKAGAVVSCSASPRHRHKKFGLPRAA